ncbi:MAG: molybdopterin molybdotransferase MoeA [Gemmatirosa sp.]
MRLSVADAVAAVLDGVAPLDAERVSLHAALGRVLAEDAVSPVALPPWDNSAMDGVAVRAADVVGACAHAPVALRIVGTVPAGGTWGGTLGTGEAVRIATGAPVPAGADAVVRVEDVAFVDDVVQVRDDRDARGDTRARRNVRPRGEDVVDGSVAVATGTRLGASALALLASIGCVDVAVPRRPRVAIVSSGDELLPHGSVDAVRAGRGIIASNALALAALVREVGGDPIDLGVAPDRPDALRERITAALDADCDVLLTTGGVSVGDRDHTRDAVAALGGTLTFWRVRMRPGGPIAAGTLGAGSRRIRWLGLPGNPVSTVVTFELFARPLLRCLSGDARPYRRTVPVTVGDAVSTPAPLMHFLRVVLDTAPDGALVARLTGPQGSGLLTSAARADALLVVPESVSSLAVGDHARALLLGEGALDAAALDAALRTTSERA